MFSLIKKSRDQAAATRKAFIGQVIVVGCFLTSASIMAHEVDQRFGGYSASDGESRFVTRFLGRADTPPFAGGDGVFSLSISAQSENIKSDDTYTQKNFEDGRRLDRSLGLDGSLTWAKRSEFTFGGSAASDSVLRTTSARVGFGQWFLGLGSENLFRLPPYFQRLASIRIFHVRVSSGRPFDAMFGSKYQ